jgi:hypothetical protein
VAAGEKAAVGPGWPAGRIQPYYLGEEFKAWKVKSSRRPGAAEDRARRCNTMQIPEAAPAGMGNEAASCCWFLVYLVFISIQTKSSWATTCRTSLLASLHYGSRSPY